jgi:galactosylceramidase
MAHYGQFVHIGWDYLNGACVNLAGGGSVVTLRSHDAGGKYDYSIIAETMGAPAAQSTTFNVAGKLSPGKLCVWTSDEKEQFVRRDDITPINGKFSIVLTPNTIYSLSTLSGQQKGSFENVPNAASFPLPYADDFEHYRDARGWGYQPHYTADITGVFELLPRPDGDGTCLKQVLDKPAQSWAPEWMPYTIIGDTKWTDYEVSADVHPDADGWAGVMGRINSTGAGYGCNPQGYYLRLYDNGRCELYASNARRNGQPGKLLRQGQSAIGAGQWHNLKLKLAGTRISGYVDGAEVLSITDSEFKTGSAGLVCGGENNVRQTAMFDNLLLNTVNGPKLAATATVANRHPMYEAAATVP